MSVKACLDKKKIHTHLKKKRYSYKLICKNSFILTSPKYVS